MVPWTQWVTNGYLRLHRGINLRWLERPPIRQLHPHGNLQFYLSAQLKKEKVNQCEVLMKVSQETRLESHKDGEYNDLAEIVGTMQMAPSEFVYGRNWPSNRKLAKPYRQWMKWSPPRSSPLDCRNSMGRPSRKRPRSMGRSSKYE